MSLIILPIMILNFFAGIVGGVWLAIAGEWGIVGYGLLITIFGVIAASLLLAPGIILAFPAIAAAERGNNFLSAVFGIPSIIYTYLVMGAWAIFIFALLISKSHNLIPAVLWSYSTATATWSYMAQKEAGSNPYSGLTATFHQFGCISLGTYYLLYFPRLNWETMAYCYGVPMVIGAAIQLILIFLNSRKSYNY